MPLFKMIEASHLQPLISNIIVKTYSKGEYIQREGHVPEGLIIIRKGSALSVTDKLSFRRLGRHAKHNFYGSSDIKPIWCSAANSTIL